MADIRKTIADIEMDPRAALSKLKAADIVKVLKAASESYYYEGKPLMSDDMFDLVKDHLQKIAPKNPYLKKIGANLPKDADAKVKLPYWLGSLDKIRDDPKAIDKWVGAYAGTYVVSDKLDGNSAMLMVGADDGKRTLYSRGDGKVGQNISHLLPLIRGIPEVLPTGLAVRGELIISRRDWKTIEHLGANARNMVAGVMHSKRPNPAVAGTVRFIAYELISDHVSPQDGLCKLDGLGFEVVHHTHVKDLSMDALSEELMRRRRDSPFEIDGIVVYHNAYHKRVSGSNPKNAFAFKSILTHDEAEVVVSHVEWNVSKDGYIKPIINFADPVVLAGAKISKATGINAAFIEKHIIGPGSRVVIIRSGDVIPKVQRVLSPAANGKPSLPTGIDYKWTDTHVDIIADVAASGDVVLKQIEHFVSTLDIKHVASGTLRKLFDNGINTIPKLVKVTVDQLLKMDGFQQTSATKIAESIVKTVKDARCEDLMVASNAFGRGLGRKKIEVIVTAFPLEKLMVETPAIGDLTKVEGIGVATAKSFVTGLPDFRKFIVSIGRDDCGKKKATPSSAKSQHLAGLTFVFTGFRSKDWEAAVVAAGGKMGSSVSKNTSVVVASDVDEDSTKLNKARELGVRVVSKETFQSEFL
jgi:NAD-dependent DNA ligase